MPKAHHHMLFRIPFGEKSGKHGGGVRGERVPCMVAVICWCRMYRLCLTLGGNRTRGAPFKRTRREVRSADAECIYPVDTAHKILSGVRIWHHYCPAPGPVGYDSVVTISLTPWKLNSLKGKYRTFFSFRSLKTIQFHHF